MKEGGIKKTISISTDSRVLNDYIGKPKEIRNVFYLKPIQS